jgi:hypothetical protein
MFAETAMVNYRLPTKENKFRFLFPFPTNKRNFAVVFHLQQTNRNRRFLSFNFLFAVGVSTTSAKILEKLIPSIPARDYHGNRPLEPYAKSESGTNLVIYDVY